jgi:AcrR family transcriptional regulator
VIRLVILGRMYSAVEELLSGEGKRPRSDARRNAERLIAAARQVLDERGLAVTTRDIAERAGVGLGTLYRRVPSLDALLTAILLDTIDEMTERARTAMSDPDPWHAFTGFAEVYVQLRAASCGLNDALSTSGTRLDLTTRINRLQRAVRRLVERTQQAGALRDDLGWRDVAFVLATAVPTDHTIGLTARPDQWHHNVRIILDGLHATTPARPPATS